MKKPNLKVLTIPEQIGEHLRQRILSGEISIGEKLPSEKELAKMYDVSRPTIRNALSYLSSHNLITSKRGRDGGNFVTRIDENLISSNFGDYLTLSLGTNENTLAKILEMRELIEPSSCGLAALNRTQQDLFVMRELLYKIEDTDDSQMYFNNDLEFHKCIAMATHNNLIIITTKAINNALKPLFHKLNSSQNLTEELTTHLWNIYFAIENKDEEQAKREMLFHLSHFETYFSDKLYKKIN